MLKPQYIVGSLAVLLLTTGFISSLLQPDETLVAAYSWSNPKHSIFNPTFSHSGHELAFVQQLHIPDGHEAEEREGVAQQRLARVATQQRLADPVVSLLKLSSKQVLRVDYGWNPSFSPDDNLLVYSFQQVPLSGKRVLAETLAGNFIKLYRRNTKQYQTLAVPVNGFLLEPIFVSAATLYYKIGAAVNGAFGGAVGLRQYNLLSKRDSMVYTPRKSFGNAHLIGEIFPTSHGADYLVWLPQDKGFGYMANEYAVELRARHTLLYSFGKLKFKNLTDKVAIAADGDIIYLDDQHELRSQKNYLVRYQGKRVAFRKTLDADYQGAYLSPDGGHVLICPYDGKPYLLNTSTLTRTTLALPAREIYSAVWSSTSKQLAVIQDDGTQDTDVVSVFTM